MHTHIIQAPAKYFLKIILQDLLLMYKNMHYILSKYSPKISSKILYKPGTKVTSLQFIPTSSSYTHINCDKRVNQNIVLLHKSLTLILHKVSPYCQQDIVVASVINTHMNLRKENHHNWRPIYAELLSETLSQKKKRTKSTVSCTLKNRHSKQSLYNYNKSQV